MALVLLTGWAYAQQVIVVQPPFSGEAFSMTKGGFGEDPRAEGQGIYQQYTVTFTDAFVNYYAGKDKVVTLTYAEVASPASGREYEVKVQNIVNEDAENPVKSLNFVLDKLLPNTEYTVTATVEVLGINEYQKTTTFTSYLGDLKDPQEGVIDLRLGQDNAQVTLYKDKVVTVSGEQIDLDEATFAVSLAGGGKTKNLQEPYLYTNGDDPNFTLQINTEYTAKVAIKYNGKTVDATTKGDFGKLELNPLWVYVVKVENGYDVVIKGMTPIAENVSAVAKIYTWENGETQPTVFYAKNNHQDVQEGENFHFLAADLKSKDSDVFSNKDKKGFFFKIDVTATIGGDEVTWVGKECNAILTPPTWPFPYDFVPLWNNGQPTLSSATITAADQVKVIETVNELIAENYWDPADPSTVTPAHNELIVNPDDVFEFTSYGVDPANVSTPDDDVIYGEGEIKIVAVETETVDEVTSNTGWYQVEVTKNYALGLTTPADAQAFIGQQYWIYFEDLANVQDRTQLFVDDDPVAAPHAIMTGIWVELKSGVTPTEVPASDPAGAYPPLIAYNLTGITANPEAAQEKYSVPTLEGAEASAAANTVTWNLADVNKDTKLNGTITVDWEYYLIYQKWVNRFYYPDVVEPNIYTQTLKDALFGDWAYTPADGKLDIDQVRVLYDGDGTAKNTVTVVLPRYFNGGEKIKNMYVKVYVWSPRQMFANYNLVSGAEAVKVEMPQDLANNPETWQTNIPVDVSDVIHNNWSSYYNVRVVIYGEGQDGTVYREYKATDDDVFATFNNRGVATVTAIDQPISITEGKLNVDPEFSLTGFDGAYKITGTLTECDEEGNAIEGGDVLTASIVRDREEGQPKTTGLYSEQVTEEQGLVFGSVKEETWYKAEFTFEYYAIRDRLDNTEVKRDTILIKGTVEFAEGVDNPFKTIKVPAEGFVEIHHPHYYLQETEGDIVARLRVWTGKDEDANCEIKVEGFDEPFTKTGTEEIQVPVRKETETFPFFEIVMETHTLQTFDVPLHVDLDQFTPEVPATWNLGYQVYITDEATGTTTANEVINKTSSRAIDTPLPYVMFMNPAPAYFYYDEVFTGISMLDGIYLDIPRLGYTYPSRADVRQMIKDNYLADFMNLLIPCLSAWNAAEWAEEYLHNNFAYTRAAVPGFENASEPEFFGAPNLVYRANIQDPAAELLYDLDLLYGPEGMGIRWWTNDQHDPDDMEPGSPMSGWSNRYGVFEEFSPYFELDENGNPVHNYVTVMPLDAKKRAAVELMLVWDEYYNALEATGEWYSYYNVSGNHAFAFSVELNDAPKGAPVEENYSYFNNVPFTALDALYTGIFPAKNRTVVIPFTGKAYVDADYTTEATVRYFSAGYLDEENSVVFRFSKKLRGGKASNELTAGYPYMVNAGESVSYADVYFHAENAEMLTSIYQYEGYDGLPYVEAYPDGIEYGWTGIEMNNYSTDAYMWGTYGLTYDFDYWYTCVESSVYWNQLRAFVAYTQGKEDLTEEEFLQNMPFFLMPAYEQYKMYTLYRFSSLDNWFWELERTSVPQFDQETGDLLPGDYDFIKPFQCALYFRGANNQNAGYGIGFRFDDDATVIKSNTIIENVNGDIYDLMGRKIAEPVKGEIYIQNGKKFIAK